MLWPAPTRMAMIAAGAGKTLGFEQAVGLHMCCAALKRGLIDSWCKPRGNGEADHLKLLEILMFSVASVIMLDDATRLERFVSRSLRVTACRRRHLAPRVNQTRPKRRPTRHFMAFVASSIRCTRISRRFAMRSPKPGATVRQKIRSTG
jgi:hypothetical protein